MASQTLAFEIGTEEIPAFDLAAAEKQLHRLVPSVLDAQSIPYGDIAYYSSPRRLIMIIRDIPEQTEEKNEIFKGPSSKIAFDENGNPTKAAEGFARGKGLTAADLIIREVDGTNYVFAQTHTPAVSVSTLLPSVLDAIIRGISWPKSQRWGSEHELFSRPVRWMVALFGADVIPYRFADVETGRSTRGHRFLAPGPFDVACADELIETIEGAYVIPTQTRREELIRDGVKALEKQTGLTAELPAKTLLEVVNLAEYPTVLMGTFDQEFLKVPEEIIVDAMLMHQRYFPLYDQNHNLTNNFLVVSNGNPDCSEVIVDGNERVVRARLYDAKFFYDEDLKQPLDAYVERLGEVVFQEKLGTMFEKTARIEVLVKHLADQLSLDDAQKTDALRSAHLCKADLVTSAVVEFTSVQGIMGSYYARAHGENDQVAQAIEQHYRPRFAGDEPPASTVGKLVATADKLDTICGLFAINQGPTGSSDPFSLRRSAIGIIAMLFQGLSISLEQAIDAALQGFDAVEFDHEAVKKEILAFFITRTKVILRDEGNKPDSIEAVLDCGAVEPADIALRVQSLERIREEMPDVMDNLAIAFSRANNLRDDKVGTSLNEAALTEPEQTLAQAINQVSETLENTLAQHDYDSALNALATLRGPIDTFFDNVLIMDEDDVKRTNRLALLNQFVAVFTHVANFEKMVTK